MVHERRRRAVDRVALLRLDRPALVHGVAGHVEHPAHDAFADGHGDGPAGVGDLEAALETFGAGHGDRPDPVVAEVLLHFERQLDRLVLDLVLDGQRVVDPGQSFRELDVHDRTDDLNDFAFVHTALGFSVGRLR